MKTEECSKQLSERVIGKSTIQGMDTKTAAEMGETVHEYASLEMYYAQNYWA